MDTLSTSIWQDFFGVSNEIAFQTIIPVLIAILIFVLGLVVRWLGNWNKNRKDNNQKREFIFSQVEVLLEAISSQKKSNEKIIETLSIEENKNLELRIIVMLNPKHINQIGSNELFKLMVLDFFSKKQERIRKFNSLIRQLDLIESLRPQLTSSFIYTQKNLSQYQDSWNNNIDMVGELHDGWISNLLSKGSNPEDDEFLKNFIKIYHKWAEIENRTDMYVAEANLIDLVLKEARSKFKNQYASEILRPLLRCKDAINNHRNLRYIKVEEFKMYVNQLNEIENDLKNFLQFYGHSTSNQSLNKELNNDEKE